MTSLRRETNDVKRANSYSQRNLSNEFYFYDEPKTESGLPKIKTKKEPSLHKDIGYKYEKLSYHKKSKDILNGLNANVNIKSLISRYEDNLAEPPAKFSSTSSHSRSSSASSSSRMSFEGGVTDNIRLYERPVLTLPRPLSPLTSLEMNRRGSRDSKISLEKSLHKHPITQQSHTYQSNHLLPSPFQSRHNSTSSLFSGKSLAESLVTSPGNSPVTNMHPQIEQLQQQEENQRNSTGAASHFNTPPLTTPIQSPKKTHVESPIKAKFNIPVLKVETVETDGAKEKHKSLNVTPPRRSISNFGSPSKRNSLPPFRSSPISNQPPKRANSKVIHSVEQTLTSSPTSQRKTITNRGDNKSSAMIVAKEPKRSKLTSIANFFRRDKSEKSGSLGRSNSIRNLLNGKNSSEAKSHTSSISSRVDNYINHVEQENRGIRRNKSQHRISTPIELNNSPYKLSVAEYELARKKSIKNLHRSISGSYSQDEDNSNSLNRRSSLNKPLPGTPTRSSSTSLLPRTPRHFSSTLSLTDDSYIPSRPPPPSPRQSQSRDDIPRRNPSRGSYMSQKSNSLYIQSTASHSGNLKDDMMSAPVPETMHPTLAPPRSRDSVFYTPIDEKEPISPIDKNIASELDSFDYTPRRSSSLKNVTSPVDKTAFEQFVSTLDKDLVDKLNSTGISRHTLGRIVE